MLLLRLRVKAVEVEKGRDQAEDAVAVVLDLRHRAVEQVEVAQVDARGERLERIKGLEAVAGEAQAGEVDERRILQRLEAAVRELVVRQLERLQLRQRREAL